MKLRCQVVGDQVVDRPASGDYPARTVRTLLVMDQDDTPLQALLTVNLDPNDPVSPVSKGAPSLVGSVVTLGVTDLSTYEGAKKISARGKLLKIEGSMRFESLSETPKKG